MNKQLKQAIGIGIVAGMRAMLAPAATATYLANQPATDNDNTAIKILRSTTGVRVLQALSAGELVGDKLPAAPNRTALGGLIGRVVNGALSAAALSKASKSNVLTGALIGGGAALASTYACFYLRRYISSRPHVKDYVTGATEDALAIALARLILK
ncbi:DUF4126 family protein [Mucilaginibacter sp. UR6-1]|uniref:DUF4126 family protein n=1 Tax=Mucilaginibacter sp. UR6-1 TaxID=1435643 RepID=UPI001E453E37|nr:DUF4126 family protein [Mucilaginibacter sp. UR6-1]MCC8408852.1 DUF4126 family protein [Mucilaginibacter sp. UR6-1]